METNTKAFQYEQDNDIYFNGKIVGKVIQDRGSMIVVEINDKDLWKEISASGNIKLSYNLVK